MKKLIILLFITANSIAQTCCDTNEKCVKNESMAVFASNKDFIAAHLSPLPYIHISEVGFMTSFETPDKNRASAYILKAKVKTNKYLFVYQEWWGLNEHIKKQAEKFYDDLDGQVNVLAIDMYDGQIATKAEDAGKLMQGAKEERLAAIMKGAIKYAGKKSKIASIGWCFGGGLSLKSAILAQKKAVGCVMYYGKPVKDVEQLKTLQCDVLGLFAGREKWISPKIVAEFEENMKAADKTIKTRIFDAEHAFANPSNPNYDKLMAADAYELAITYIRDRFL